MMSSPLLHLLIVCFCAVRVLALAAAVPDDLSVQSSASSTKGALCCTALALVLGSKVSFPKTAGYNAFVSSYWSAQEQAIRPSCVLSATSAQDVSTTIRILAPLLCKFAVRSGGHAALAGIANIPDGVTIDLGSLNQVKLSTDKLTVAVGPGQNWGGVYTALQPQGVAVPGGRASGVGVGGSTLGDGWGFLANQAGFGCDNVVEYEVVLASGTIVTATQTSNKDLWKALKGGGGNFGIVTKFVFRTYAVSSQIWAGGIVQLAQTQDLPQLATAIYDFTANPQYKPKATLLVGYGSHPGLGLILFIQVVNLEPVDRPAVFNDFYALPGVQLYNTTSLTTLPGYAALFNLDSPSGLQQITWDFTFVSDKDTMQELWTLTDGSQLQLSNVTGIDWSLAFQPIARGMTAASDTASGGNNVLGIGQAPAQGLQLAILSASFPNAADYTKVKAVADKLLADVVAAAKRRNTYRPWVDLNHANWNQDVFASYGAANQQFLRTTAKAYDPFGVFQNLKPGGFKLW
ncbi:FAD binding domain protein [Lasiosphaeria miniovina]|uniref:FAD binding domain protein n=1 Tax=Lasiosphaeria miniovina TaxID=1954250 RepID=A0AA40A6C5_9PEZI|nr:FAD binding domain protein [Lasiosphaeria miniovina]KAK0710020.1 FAD binding domain protein [Lasiosphaeria miniovina]